MQVTRILPVACAKTYSKALRTKPNPDLNNIFHEQYKDSREQMLALEQFTGLTDEVKAVYPLFAGACSEYNNAVLYSKYVVLNAKDAEHREEVFYSLIKACNDDSLPVAVKENLLSLKAALNQNDAFVDLDLVSLNQAKPNFGLFDVSDLNLGKHNRE